MTLFYSYKIQNFLQIYTIAMKHKNLYGGN